MLSSDATHVVADTVDVENVFSTTLYQGTAATQTINTGTAAPAGDAMTWIKSRAAGGAGIFDTIRGIQSWLLPNDAGSGASTGTNWLNSLTSSQLGLNGTYFNNSGVDYTAWTFKKQPKFFDIVTWTGDGVGGRVITHSLTTRPGFVIIRRINGAGSWYVYHQGSAGFDGWTGDLTTAALSSDSQFNTNITATQLNIGNWLGNNANASGATYVAYLFASDAGGFGPLGTDNIIKCGKYTGNGATGGQVINCGFEAQWVLVRNAALVGGNWFMIDATRGWLTNGDFGADRVLLAENSGGEGAQVVGDTHPQGFRPIQNNVNQSTQTYIYVAIRKPSKIPKLGTEVLHITNSSAATGTKITTGFPFDMQIQAYPLVASDIKLIDRKRGFSSTATESAAALLTSDTNAESTPLVSRYWDNTGFQIPSVNNGISTNYYSFKRAPGFFDVVTYSGDGNIGVNIPHALGAVPELMIIRARTTGRSWTVYAASKGNAQATTLSTSNGFFSSGSWNNTTPTASQFTISNTIEVNETGNTYVAYLFATLPGISKVGTYTGTGAAAQTIDCGFLTGARFVLTKRSDATGGFWYLFDTALGINSGTESYFSLGNSLAAFTGSNFINPAATGFTINASADNNQSGIPYIFFAVS